MELTRREALMALLGLPLTSSLLVGGCETETTRKIEGTLYGPDMALGHRLRDHSGGTDALGAWDNVPTRNARVVIVGGGPAGLSAAWRLSRADFDDYALLELEPFGGGTSHSGESSVTPYPWGAHYVPVPLSHDVDLIRLLREMGAITGTDHEGKPIPAEEALVREPEERIFYKGFWYGGLYPYAGATAHDLAELARFRRVIDRYVAMRDGKGRRAFAIPISLGSDDASITALDRLSAAAWLEREGFTSKRLHWLVNYACRDDYGLESKDTSAWAAIFYWASRTNAPGEDTSDLLAWPDGNGAIVKHLVRTAGSRLHTRKLVVDIEATENDIVVRLLDGRTHRPETWRAKHVIVATPRFVAQRVVRALRSTTDGEAQAAFTYGAWMVANLHLDERPVERSYFPAWDNVLYDSPSLGYVNATHQRGRSAGPTVWTYFLPITQRDARAGRAQLLATTWTDWAELVLRDLSRPHPDLRAHIRKIDVWRWGHAMIQPRVGTVWSLARRRAHEAIGPIHFAHSDLSGVALFEEAFSHGLRAADEVLHALNDGGSLRGSQAT